MTRAAQLPMEAYFKANDMVLEIRNVRTQKPGGGILNNVVGAQAQLLDSKDVALAPPVIVPLTYVAGSQGQYIGEFSAAANVPAVGRTVRIRVNFPGGPGATYQGVINAKVVE